LGGVTLESVSKRFAVKRDGKTETVEALYGVSFGVAEGEVVVLIGPSGCGKTTLLRIVMGLERPSAGRVVVDGRVVEGCGHDRGMVFQHAALLPWLSALDNVKFALEMKGLRGRPLEETARRHLELVGLADAGSRRPHQLSGGMQQRVGIARALAIDPDVLLMDEPFGALDAQTRESLQDEFLRIHARAPKTVLMVTHDLDEAVLLADRVLVMKRGRVEATLEVELPRPRGSVESTRTEPAFARLRHAIWEILRGEPQAAGALG
jgi:NitT/TauT family transport system ATP-binding protein